jgi:hypothetical protein
MRNRPARRSATARPTPSAPRVEKARRERRIVDLLDHGVSMAGDYRLPNSREAPDGERRERKDHDVRHRDRDRERDESGDASFQPVLQWPDERRRIADCSVPVTRSSLFPLRRYSQIR